MDKIVLSIDEMKRLRELGIDTKSASICWVDGKRVETWDKTIECVWYRSGVLTNDDKYVPTFTLQDILKILESVKYNSIGFPMIFFSYNYSFGVWETCFRNPTDFNISFKDKSPLKCAYDMLVWCAENNILTNK